MSYPIWITPAGSLGTLPDSDFFQIQLDAYNPGGGALTYNFISGQLPPGIQLTRSGSLRGVPVVVGASIPSSYLYDFTVRVTNTELKITDQTFSLTISNIIPPVITPRTTFLGDYFDGAFFSLQLKATEVDPEATLTWSLTTGSLPNGVTLSPSGLISGFIYPLPQLGVDGETGFGNAPFNYLGYDSNGKYQDARYEFTVAVTDGANNDSLSYSLQITSRGQWTSDNNIDTVDEDYFVITIDTIPEYTPIVTTPPQSLPTVRSNSNFAFKFDAIDPDGDNISYGIYIPIGVGFDASGFDSDTFDQAGEQAPPGLILDPATGWFYGHIPAQAAATQTYTFSIYAFKTDKPGFASIPITYTLTVLGDINNTVTWITPGNLGIINNGSISDLSVSAVSNANKVLVYTIVGDVSRFPQGLTLLPSGLISGRCTFEYFSLDHGTTIIDDITIDNTYTFTIQARTVDGTASAQQQFTIRINNFNIKPYENLYLKALPTLDQRLTFLNIVNNRDIFPEDLIYRPEDPWFGRAKEMRSLFLAGINPETVGSYIQAMTNNHYNKLIDFSNIKTARALDTNFDVKYEVVYIELEDNQTNNGLSPANSRELHNANFFEGNPDYNTYYPNSFANMSSDISSAFGYENQGALPDWMTSVQQNGRQLGFTRAIVLAYTVSGASKLIAYRLQANGLKFNSIDFVADRYLLDNHLTKNFDIELGAYYFDKNDAETTFDHVPHSGSVKYSAVYGLTGITFEHVNNQSVDYFMSATGLTNRTEFAPVTGDTIIFMQQENYPGNTSPHDGWNNGALAIPGYIDNQANPNTVNQRIGIWTVTVTENNIIQLTFTTPVNFNESVNVGYGIDAVNHSINYDFIALYDPTIYSGLSSPAYTIVTLTQTVKFTQFDNSNTKFIAGRDTYADPETDDKYLKFPKTGVFK